MMTMSSDNDVEHNTSEGSLARNDGGIIGRHGHAGAVMVGLGAGNYGGGYGGPERGGKTTLAFHA